MRLIVFWGLNRVLRRSPSNISTNIVVANFRVNDVCKKNRQSLSLSLSLVVFRWLVWWCQRTLTGKKRTDLADLKAVPLLHTSFQPAGPIPLASPQVSTPFLKPL